jgi:hypothetical protein
LTLPKSLLWKYVLPSPVRVYLLRLLVFTTFFSMFIRLSSHVREYLHEVGVVPIAWWEA